MKRFLLPALLLFLISFSIKAQFTVIPQNAFCANTCTGNAHVVPGGNYYFQWSNGDTGQFVINLCPGAYWMDVFDSAFHEIDSINFFINQPPPLAVNVNIINVTCNGGADGIVTMAVTGGVAPYTYNWSTGATTQTMNNLPAGTYTITLTDANGCTATANATINQPPPIMLSDTSFDVSVCNACDGSVNLSVFGGTPAYNYLWSNFTTTQNIAGLCTGWYNCIITDANGCTVTHAANVSAPTNGLIATLTSTGIHCNNSDTTTVTISGGLPPYTITWDNYSAPSAWGTSPFHHNYDTVQVYYIAINDTAGCFYSLVDTVKNLGVHVSIFTLASPTCALPNSGKLKATVSGGYPPYFYLWNNAATLDSIVNLASGNYSVTVTDSLGCTSTASALVVNNNGFLAYAYGNTASCDSAGLGSATIYATGGNPPYSYLWGTVPPQTTQSATGIHAGNYSFTVTDNGGCSVTNTANIAFTSFSFYTYITIDSLPNCGNNTGQLTAHHYNGASPFTYHWDDNQTTQTAIHLAPGYHYVTITDAGGCAAYGSGYLENACYNTITGNIFVDANNNCVYDTGDSHLSYATVYATNGTHTYYGNPDYSGNYSIQVNDTGTFTIHAQYYGYYQSCGNITPCGNAALPVTFHSYNNTSSNINFGFAGSSGFDLYLHPGWYSANPGFTETYWVYYGNQSPQVFTGAATVTFKYDNNLVYQSSQPPLPTHNAAAHTLTWVVNGVGNWDYRGQCYFTVPVSLPAGYLLQSDFYITPTTGDCDSSDNHMHFSELVTSSRDPNEKEVSPAGSIYDEDTVLTYTIRFQNTGTDTTWFIIVKDTLSHNLDPLTVRNLASSHPYSSFNISGEGILTWIFNPIFLVDSTTNEPASKGFVTFSIKKKNNLPIGSTISNKASIYFDYNEPVVTNTVADTVADPNYIFEVRGNSNVSVAAFPNPFSQSTHIVISGLNEKFDFTLFDVTGRMKKNITSIETNSFEMKRDDLAAGVYFYKISTGKHQVAYGKLVVE